MFISKHFWTNYTNLTETEQLSCNILMPVEIAFFFQSNNRLSNLIVELTRSKGIRSIITFLSKKVWSCWLSRVVCCEKAIIDTMTSLTVLLFLLTLSWRRPISYRNQSTELRSKSMDWFLYDIGLRHERVKPFSKFWKKKQSYFRLSKVNKKWSYYIKTYSCYHLKKGFCVLPFIVKKRSMQLRSWLVKSI